jgi:hypothetical protein
MRGFRGAPRSGGVVGKIARGQSVPHIEDGLNHAPTGFHHVGALEQRGVADHAIAQQTLVAGAVFRAEIGGVIEIHIDEAELHH